MNHPVDTNTAHGKTLRFGAQSELAKAVLAYLAERLERMHRDTMENPQLSPPSLRDSLAWRLGMEEECRDIADDLKTAMMA